MIATRSERIAIPDGELGAHVALPAAGAGRGLVLLHEIFGVNVYVRDVAERLGELGYVVLAPDLYWRTQPGFALDEHDEEGVRAGIAAIAAARPRGRGRRRDRGARAAARDARGARRARAPMFHDPQAAAAAWRLTSAFL